jgi:phage I-like protein
MGQEHVEISDLSFLSYLAAEEVDKLSRNVSSEGRYLETLAKHLERQIAPEMGVKNLAPSVWGMYRKAINEATQLNPQDFRQLDDELKSILKKLQEAKDDAKRMTKGATERHLGDAHLKTLLAFLWSLHNQLLAVRQQTGNRRATMRYRV